MSFNIYVVMKCNEWYSNLLLQHARSLAVRIQLRQQHGQARDEHLHLLPVC